MRWTPIRPLPGGYVEVIHRCFPSGLHVALLIRPVAGGFEVVSSIDHGTMRLTIQAEGRASTLPDATELLRKTCARWDSPDTPQASSCATPRRWHYLRKDGTIQRPATRERLLDLLAAGELTWDTRVWEKGSGAAAGGEWESLQHAMGLPPEVDRHPPGRLF